MEIKQSLEGNTNYITDPVNLEKQFQTHARNNYLSNNGDYRQMIKTKLNRNFKH